MAGKVFIDIDEEIIFIVEKLREVEDDKVIVSIPQRALFLGSVVSMQLLAREVSKLSKLVVLVSPDEVGAKLSEKVGLILVGKVSDINDETWKKASEYSDELNKSLKKTREKLVEERKSQEEDKITKEPAKQVETKKGNLLVGKPKLVIVDGYELVAGGDIRKLEQAKKADRRAASIEKQDKSPSISSLEKDEIKEGLSKSPQNFSSHEAQSKKQPRKEFQIAERSAAILASVTSFFQQGGLIKKIAMVLVVIYIASYFLIRPASLTVFVKTESVNASEVVKADTDIAGANVASLTIPAAYLEQTVDRSTSAPTTDEIETGEKAQGEVGVFNKTSKAITIPQGTVLTDKVNGKEYGTNFEVTIEGAVDSGSSLDFGYADIGVTAVSFGEDYNTGGKNLNFSINGFSESELTGKNFKDIKGGTTEKVKVVAQADVDTIKTQLNEQLKQDALGKLQESIDEDIELIEDTFLAEVTSEVVSPKVGERGESVSVGITITGKVLSFKKTDLDPLTQSILANQASQALDIENYEYDPHVELVEGNTVTIRLDITGNVTPSLDSEDLLQKIAGKSIGQTESILGEEADVQNYELKSGPWWIPSFMRQMPSDPEKIKFTLQKVK